MFLADSFTYKNEHFFFIYYIWINEIQSNIDEITCIFQKVLFSLVKNIKSVISLVKNINFWMTSAFFISFLCNCCLTSDLQTLVTSCVNKNIKYGYVFSGGVFFCFVCLFVFSPSSFCGWRNARRQCYVTPSKLKWRHKFDFVCHEYDFYFISWSEKIYISFAASLLMKYIFFTSLDKIKVKFVTKIWIASIYEKYTGQNF